MKVHSPAVSIATAVSAPTFCRGRASPRVRTKKPAATMKALAQMATAVLRVALIAAVSTDCDASDFQVISERMLSRGFTHEDIARMWGENFMRVWREVDALAER